MISIVEPLCHGMEHASVNAGLIRVVRQAFPDEPLAFYAAHAHLDEVRSTLNGVASTAVTWRPIDIPPRTAGFSQRWRHDAALLRRVAALNASVGGTAGHVLSLQSTPSVLLTAAGLRGAGVVRQPIYAVLHGYLNEAFGWRSRNPFVRAFDMRSALKLAAPRVRLIALDPGIAEAVSEQLPSVGAQIVTVRLPVPLVPALAVQDPTPDGPIRFAFLGLATPAKGFDAFVAAARAARLKHGERVEFHALGRLPTNGGWDMDALQSCLATSPSPVSMARADYDAQVARMHYVCLPYHADHYTLSASGVLLDALAHGKPILASATPAVRELFADASPGILMEDPDRLDAAVNEAVATFDVQRYQEQVAQMALARERRSVARVAEDYRAIHLRAPR